MKQELIGKGMCGDVYKAFNYRTKRKCALKCINLNLLEAKFSVQNANRHSLLSVVKNEVEALSILEHPNIVGLYDAFQVGNMYYICMELVRGFELNTLIPAGGMHEVLKRPAELTLSLVNIL